jgi:hypothetical protein
MPFFAVLCLVFLFIAALGQSWWWRGPSTPTNYWYGNAAFYWGMFFLALYIVWPTVHSLSVSGGTR